MKTCLHLVIFGSFVGLRISTLPIGIPEKKHRGLVVIPGVGNAKRLNNTFANMQMLKHQRNAYIEWDCLVFIYANRQQSKEFWNSSLIKPLKLLCLVRECPNCLIVENLRNLHPHSLKHVYKYVCILLDDVRLKKPPGFSMNRLCEIMKYNNCTAISPRVRRASRGEEHDGRSLMVEPPISGTVGFVVAFAELFAWVMTAKAYSLLYELLLPAVNPYGWGFDNWYDGYARLRYPETRLCIASELMVIHLPPNRFPNGSAILEDGTPRTEKINALRRQERYFRDHLGVDLYGRSTERKDGRKEGSTAGVGAIERRIYGVLVAPPANH